MQGRQRARLPLRRAAPDMRKEIPDDRHEFFGQAGFRDEPIRAHRQCQLAQLVLEQLGLLPQRHQLALADGDEEALLNALTLFERLGA